MIAYSLFSGSSGNCIFLREKDTRILIDAGGSMRRIEQSLNRIGESLSEINAVFLTHEHSDHTKAIPMICKHGSVPIYCQREVAKELYLSYLNEDAVKAALLAKYIRTVNTGEEYEIGSLLISPFKTPHDSVNSQGFVVGEGKLGIATDLGHVSREVFRYLETCDNVILESNHDLAMLWDGPYPPYLKERVASDHGHLNNEDCAEFSRHLLQKGCRSFTLFHLSEENNTPQKALDTTRAALLAAGAEEGMDFELKTADRFDITRVL